ncbi:chromosome partitioning protein [Agromyces sp. 3263]|nr:chromosome partitioning protein [Agromyces sp. 3263]
MLESPTTPAQPETGQAASPLTDPLTAASAVESARTIDENRGQRVPDVPDESVTRVEPAGPAPMTESSPRTARGDAGRPADPVEVDRTARAAPSIDWDVATAAALADDPEATAAATPHAGSTASADRLLEDLIREIVGDAAADTVSSLQPTRTASAAAASGASSTTASTAAPPAPAPSTPFPSPSTSLNSAESTLVRDGSPTTTVTRPPVEQRSDEVSGAAPLTDRGVAAIGPSDHDSADAPSARGTTARVATASATGLSPAVDPREPDSVERVQRDVDADGGRVAATLDLRVGVPADSTASTNASPTVSRETPVPTLPPIPVSRETDVRHGGTPLADQLAEETRRRIALDEAVLPLPASTRVLTISNQKGGVGKTTSAVNLAAALARSGAHVLVIDLDPQGNASTALGVDHRSEQQSVYDVLVADLPLADVVRPSTEHESLDCVPATIHLAGAEIELVSLVAREQRLRRALDRHLVDMERPYDYVFIDCPPSLGLLTINAFVAAREVLIPIQCEYYALEGLSQLLSNIELIEKHLNPELRLSTILLTMYDSRTNLAQQVAQEVRDHFPAQTLETIIPRSVRVSEAPSYGQSVISYDFSSSGSLSYREAAAEIALRGAVNQKDDH